MPNQMPTKQDVGSRIKIFDESGESKWIRSGGGCPQGWSYTDPTLKTVESLPDPAPAAETKTHEITQDEMPSQGDPQEPQAA